VGGVDKNGLYDSQVSLYGASVMITAPDTKILTICTNNLGKSSYLYLNGTSFSAPLVSATAGLLLSFKASLSTQNILSALQRSATDKGDKGRDIYYGYGILNSYKALAQVDTAPPIIFHTALSEFKLSAQNFYVSANITDNFPEFISASIRYRFITIDNPNPPFYITPLVNSSGIYEALLPPFPYGTQSVEYRLVASDLNQNTIEYPPLITSVLSVPIRDDVGPIVSLAKPFSSAFYDTSPLEFQLKDPSGVSLNFIEILIKTSQEQIKYTLLDTGISLSHNALLGLDPFLLKNLPFNEPILFTIKSKDLLSNVSTHLFTLTKNSVFSLSGPSGPNPINTPNPFNPKLESTKFCFEISQDALVSIDIYTLDLKKVKTILNTYLTTGYYQSHEWDGRDEFGTVVPNGVYLFVIKAKSKDILIIKKNRIAILQK
jgi:hypothetical protein